MQSSNISPHSAEGQPQQQPPPVSQPATQAVVPMDISSPTTTTTTSAPTQQPQQLQLTSTSLPLSLTPNQIQTSTQQTCSIATTPTVVSQLPQGPRAVSTGQPGRPHEYLVLIPNPRQPGVQGIRYPIQAMNLNQPNILQANPALFRSINASQIIRAQTSSSGVMQTQTSQAQTTTMANIQGRPIHIPFSAAGPRGPITLANGQTIMPSIPIQRHPMMTSRATILQQPTLIRGVTQQGMGVHPIIPTSQTLGLGMPASMVPTSIVHRTNALNTTPTSGANAPSLMTPEEALTKGKNFFVQILTKLDNTKKKTMQNLVQALIDGSKTSEEFATELHKELKSTQQTQLVPFLDILLPILRQSMNAGQTILPGIRPPNRSDGPIITPQLQPQLQSQQQLPQTPLIQPTLQPTDSPLPSTSSTPVMQSNTVPPVKKKKTPLAPGQKSAYAIKKEAREARKRERELLAAAALGVKIEPVDDRKEPDKTEKPLKPKPDKPKRQDKQKKQEKQLESLSSALRDDDDVNDVAAMGGVNLAEENQRIMASGAELVGTQIRSCKDEPFLDTNALTSRIAKIATRFSLAEPSKDVVTIISHATQERLKNMVERLGILAEHRSENLKLNPRYEVSSDIKSQIKFLAELDRIEKRRYEEQERELLLRVAKSRSKAEDPEQQKLRQKAKDMQRAEQEEVRQREANETALLAIGPRKKVKTSATSSLKSFSQSSNLQDIKTSVETRGDSIRRVKRVNMRDLQVLLELDRTHLNRLVKITAL